MPNQVNPLGSLVAGVLQTAQVSVKPPYPASSKSVSASTDAQAKVPEGQPVDPSSGNLDVAAEKIKAYLKNSQSDLDFSVDKDTGDFVFKIINRSTQDVIRQVPSEEVLAMARKLRDISNSSDASGVLMDAKG